MSEPPRIAVPTQESPPTHPVDRLWILLATGLGTGYAKRAPGTFGSLLGPPLVWLLGCDARHPWISVAMAVAGFFFGVFVCQAAVRLFHAKDPQAVVIDEIAAFLWIYLFTPLNWITAIAGFLMFRLFDISKPWPLRKLERLPGGWGVMSDDAAAGLISAAVLGIAWRLIGG